LQSEPDKINSRLDPSELKEANSKKLKKPLQATPRPYVDVGVRGRGLFAERSYKKDEFVTFYKGEAVTREQVNDPNRNPMYLMALDYGRSRKPTDDIFLTEDVITGEKKPAFALDALHGPFSDDSLGRYINSAKGSADESNVSIGKSQFPNGIKIRTTRKVSKGEEFLMGYGTHYWNAVEKYMRAHPDWRELSLDPNDPYDYLAEFPESRSTTKRKTKNSRPAADERLRTRIPRYNESRIVENMDMYQRGKVPIELRATFMLCGQYGVYATDFIPKSMTIDRYGGEVIRQEEAEMIESKELLFPNKTRKRNSAYFVHSGGTSVIDGSKKEYVANCINHYQWLDGPPNVARGPNCVLMPLKNESTTVCVVAVRDIQKNEQLLLDYGEAYWDFKSPDMVIATHPKIHTLRTWGERELMLTYAIRYLDHKSSPSQLADTVDTALCVAKAVAEDMSDMSSVLENGLVCAGDLAAELTVVYAFVYGVGTIYAPLSEEHVIKLETIKAALKKFYDGAMSDADGMGDVQRSLKISTVYDPALRASLPAEYDGESWYAAVKRAGQSAREVIGATDPAREKFVVVASDLYLGREYITDPVGLGYLTACAENCRFYKYSPATPNATFESHMPWALIDTAYPRMAGGLHAVDKLSIPFVQTPASLRSTGVYDFEIATYDGGNESAYSPANLVKDFFSGDDVLVASTDYPPGYLVTYYSSEKWSAPYCLGKYIKKSGRNSQWHTQSNCAIYPIKRGDVYFVIAIQFISKGSVLVMNSAEPFEGK